MTTENVTIVVSQRGAKTVSRDIGEIGDSAAKSAKGVDLLKRALAAMGGVLAASKIVEWADGWTVANNRIGLFTKSVSEQTTVVDQLFKAAQRTRTEFGVMTELFSRAALSSDDLGASQQDLIKFSEGVGQALAIQGTSAQAASGALLQLGQMLGGNRVQAQEYNSLLDNGIVILKTVAENMDGVGGSVANLTNLVKNGTVAPKQFFEAFLKGADSLEKKFLSMAPTIGQSLQVLDNSMGRLIGENGGGLSQGLAKGILGVADAIDNLAGVITGATKVVFAFAAAWATYRLGLKATEVLAAISAQAQLTSAVAAGNAVLLGSAEANRQKAVAAQAGAVADAAAAGAALRKAVAEETAAAAAVASIGAVRAQLVVERQLEVVRLQAQITDQGRTASLTRLAEIRRVEAVMATQQTAAETALNAARAAGTAADNARAAALGRVAGAQGALATSTAAAAGSTTILGQGLAKLKGLLSSLGAGFLANPWVALATAIVAAGVAIYAFRDDIVLVQQDSITLGDYFRATWQILGEWVNKAIDWLGQFAPVLDQVGKWFLDLGQTFKKVINFTRTTANAIIGLWVGAFRATISVWKTLPAAMWDIATQASNRVREALGMDPLENAAAGAADRAANLGATISQEFAAGLKADYVGAAMSPIIQGFDDLTERARVFAKERKAAADASTGMGGGGGTPTPVIDEKAAKKAAKELEALKDSLAQVLDTIDPVGAALRELADAESVLDKSVKAGLITTDQRNVALAAYREHLSEALDPLGALNKELQREIALTKMSNGEREVAQQLFRLEDELKTRGVKLTKEQSEELRKQITLIQALSKDGDALNRIREDTLGKLQDIVREQKALSAAQQQGIITSELYRSEMARTNIELAALQNSMGMGDNGTIFLEGVGSVLEGYTTLASGVADIIGSTFQTLTDGISGALANAIIQGEDLRTSLHNISKTIATELLGSLIKLGIQYAINAAIGNSMAAAATATSAAMAASVASAWAPAASMVSLASYGANSGPAIAGMTAASVAAQGLALPGFKTGGDFTVDGVGGPDSRLVAFKATPGERVTIETPAQQRANGGNGGSTHIHFHGVTDMDSFKRSESQVHARLSQTVERANRRNN